MVLVLVTMLFLVCTTSAQLTNKDKTGVCKDINYKSLITMEAKLDRVISMFNSDKTATKLEQGYLPVDCQQILLSGMSRGSGVYTIYSPVDPLQKREVYCDMETDGGGWLVFQRRISNAVNFDRLWRDYAGGFGDVTGNFWLGNELLHSLTYYKPQELRVDLEKFDNMTAYADYQEFKVDSETNKYRLSVSAYSGTAGDSLSHHDGAGFTTRDVDNDSKVNGNCAVLIEGAWWYKNCESVSLNGPYHPTETNKGFWYNGVSWDSFGGDYGEGTSLKFSEMKIRPDITANRA